MRERTAATMPVPAMAATAAVTGRGLRGAACSATGDGAACGDGLACFAGLPGGYCASSCGVGGSACPAGAACVATPRAGEICALACSDDRDCRVDEGYVCDPLWHACAVPGFAAIAPRRCDASSGRDAEFASASASIVARGELGARAPAAVLAPRGRGVIGVATVGSEVIAFAAGAARGSGSAASTVLGRDAASEPAIARAGDTVVAAWRRGGERPAIELASARDGQPWTAAHGVVADGDCDAGDRGCPARPRLAVSSRGGVFVSYSSDAIGTRVRGSHDGGATWSAPTTALTGARGDLAIGADGRVHVVAMAGGVGGAYGAAQHELQYTWSADGGRTWARAAIVSARDERIPAYFANPTITVDDRHGYIYVAYVSGGNDAAWAIAIAVSKDRGKTWTRTHLDGDGCATALIPALAIDAATGDLHVAYYDTRGPAAGRFAHAVCTPGATRCFDRGAIESSPFAALDLGRLDARWLGDAAAIVVDDRTRTLHAVWAEPMIAAGAGGGGDAIVTSVMYAAGKLRP